MFSSLKRTKRARLLQPAAFILINMKKCIGQYEFQFICEIMPLKDSQRVIFEYNPRHRYEKKESCELNHYGKLPFCKFSIPANFTDCGVYAIVVDDTVVYVGECENLTRRFGGQGYGNISPRNCYKNGQSTNCRINNLVLQMVKQNKTISLYFVQTDKRKTIETELLELYKPVWNIR